MAAAFDINGDPVKIAAMTELRSGIKSRLALLALNFRRRRVVSDVAKIVISITTYRARLDKFSPVLESILRQDIRRDYAVHVHLSRADLDLGIVPADLKRFEASGVRFYVHEENLRSYKKLVYEYGAGAGASIVTADDDIIYPSYWLRRLVESSEKNPGCIVAYRAHYLGLSDTRELVPYSEMMESKAGGRSRKVPCMDLMPTGVSGVLYPYGSLAPICTDRELFLKYAPLADDIWFKISSMMKGTKVVQVDDQNRHFAMVPGSQADSLYQSNVGASRNDEQLKNCFGAYPQLFDILAQSPR